MLSYLFAINHPVRSLYFNIFLASCAPCSLAVATVLAIRSPRLGVPSHFCQEAYHDTSLVSRDTMSGSCLKSALISQEELLGWISLRQRLGSPLKYGLPGAGSASEVGAVCPPLRLFFCWSSMKTRGPGCHPNGVQYLRAGEKPQRNAKYACLCATSLPGHCVS